MAERTSPATLRSQPDYDASPTYLTSALPPRAGQRPRTESCLPHAQMEAESPDAIFEALTAAASASLGKDVVEGPTTVSVPSTWPARTASACCLKSAWNLADSLPCVSRYCTGAPPRLSSNSTVLYAAIPDSSCDVSEPSQKWRSHDRPALPCLVESRMYESPSKNLPKKALS